MDKGRGDGCGARSLRLLAISRGTASTEAARILDSAKAFGGKHEFRLQAGSEVPVNRAGWLKDGEYVCPPTALTEAFGFDAKHWLTHAAR